VTSSKVFAFIYKEKKQLTFFIIIIRKRHGSVFYPIRQTDDKRAENTQRRLAFARMSGQVKKMAVPNNIVKKKFKKPSL
jgi:hypothetical protein